MSLVKCKMGSHDGGTPVVKSIVVEHGGGFKKITIMVNDEVVVFVKAGM